MPEPGDLRQRALPIAGAAARKLRWLAKPPRAIDWPMAPPELAVALAPPAAAPAPVPTAPAAPSRPRPRARRDAGSIVADLHARHGAELLRFCRWMLKDPDDAADALQDTWIRAMSALGEERVAVTALRPWLYAIARNVCLDRLRERQRRSRQDIDESASGETPGADDVVALRQEAGAALALVAQLSERQRAALLMRELAGMSIPEIAGALGVSPERAAWSVGDARRAVEAARGGDELACEDARARLAAGHRGRTLRAHLGRCQPCLTHDRRLRAKRVLAPAFLPVLWLKRLTLPLFVNPATAATVAAAAVAAAAPHPAAPSPAPPPARVAVAATASAGHATASAVAAREAVRRETRRATSSLRAARQPAGPDRAAPVRPAAGRSAAAPVSAEAAASSAPAAAAPAAAAAAVLGGAQRTVAAVKRAAAVVAAPAITQARQSVQAVAPAAAPAVDGVLDRIG